MKIVHFSTSHFSITISLANKMAEHAKVYLILPSNLLEKSHFKSISKKVIFLPIEIPRQIHIFSSLITLYKLLITINRIQPSIFHVQGFGHAWLPFLFPFLNCKIVSTVHDPQPHVGDQMSKGDRFSVLLGHYLSDHFIVHGKYLKEQVIDFFSVSRDKITVVPLSASLNINTKKNNQDTSNPSILFFGRIWKYKGLKYLIKAEPLIRNKIKNFKIIIAGEGESFAPYEKLIQNTDSFIIKNYRISEEEMHNLFAECSIVVLPYIEATQSGIIPYAFQYGKPVIATEVGSIPDVIDNQINGILIAPKDSTALANEIINLLSNKERLRLYSKNARKKYKLSLSPTRCLYETLKSYKKCLIS